MRIYCVYASGEEVVELEAVLRDKTVAEALHTDDLEFGDPEQNGFIEVWDSETGDNIEIYTLAKAPE